MSREDRRTLETEPVAHSLNCLCGGAKKKKMRGATHAHWVVKYIALEAPLSQRWPWGIGAGEWVRLKFGVWVCRGQGASEFWAKID